MARATSARTAPRRTSAITCRGHAGQPPRRFAQRRDLVVVLPDAGALDDAFGRDELGMRRSVARERVHEPRVTADRQVRRLEADPHRDPEPCSGSARRAARRASHRTEPSTVTSSRSGHSCAVPRAVRDRRSTYRKSVMKWTRDRRVTTTIAELPVKLVRYRMFGSEVTTSASSDRADKPSRMMRCRCSSAAAGRVRHGWRRATARAPRWSRGRAREWRLPPEARRPRQSAPRLLTRPVDSPRVPRQARPSPVRSNPPATPFPPGGVQRRDQSVDAGRSEVVRRAVVAGRGGPARRGLAPCPTVYTIRYPAPYRGDRSRHRSRHRSDTVSAPPSDTLGQTSADDASAAATAGASAAGSDDHAAIASAIEAVSSGVSAEATSSAAAGAASDGATAGDGSNSDVASTTEVASTIGTVSRLTSSR